MDTTIKHYMRYKYDQGYTIAELADALQISRYFVQKYLKEVPRANTGDATAGMSRASSRARAMLSNPNSASMGCIRPIDEETREEAEEIYRTARRQGYGIRWAASTANVSTFTLSRMAPQRRRRKTDATMVNQWRRLRGLGYNTERIGSMYDVSGSTVRRYLRGEGKLEDGYTNPDSENGRW